ncbi:MAG: RNA-binding transcriptional accessory protein [Rhodopirellula sp.]|nr:RNA-binding transcriptional accessory protein [Rhodopirellula sp.]
MNLASIAKELSFTIEQVTNVVALLDDGNTVPFITRYRKEQTGNLDEEQIRAIEKRVTLLRQLAEKAETILRQIDSQGKLTPQLRQQIEAADTLKRLDDLYLPFRPKRRSRAEVAREKGLEPLAELIMRGEADSIPLAKAAAAFVSSNADEGIATKDEALSGAADILAERISEDVVVRDHSRKIAWRTGRITVSATKKSKENSQEFENYFDYSEPVWKVPPHRTLALNRGEKEEVLRIKFDWDRSVAARIISGHYHLESHAHREFLQDCIQDSLDRLIHPSIEREVRREITEQAEEHAIGVFAKNLRSLLLQPPLRNEGVLAIDPGFRTGCKIAILDDRGQCLHTDVVYVTGSADKRQGTLQRLADLVSRYSCGLIAIGNGTACRETEELISQLIADHCPDCRYLIVNEAGASIYSASTVAREEFPDYDATVRGTISIGRRLQDPLSELVKIEPQHIGVGMYQHDMNPRQMKESLDGVVESCVNFVGVDLNTASASLLKYVSGFSPLIARRVVEWREANGSFASRKQLLEVAGVGKSTFTQAAGFLKISNGAEPLDQTWIHPESYKVAHRVLENLSLTPADLQLMDHKRETLQNSLKEVSLKQLAVDLDVGQPTLKDIIDALSRPGRDPRTDLPGPIFRSGVLKLDDLATGMELTGTVLNVVDFGAFVDIGLKDTGLVHISQMADRFISSPHEVVSVGDIVTVWVQSVDNERRRVSLTMKKPA